MTTGHLPIDPHPFVAPRILSGDVCQAPTADGVCGLRAEHDAHRGQVEARIPWVLDIMPLASGRWSVTGRSGAAGVPRQVADTPLDCLRAVVAEVETWPEEARS